MIETSLESTLGSLLRKVDMDESLSEVERAERGEELIDEYNSMFRGSYGQLYEKYGEEITERLNNQKTFDLLFLALDAVSMLLPTILLFNGYTTASLLFFAAFGVISSLHITKTMEEEGMDIELTTNILVVSTYLIIQAPYIVLGVLLRFF